ncbi:hypothetical protein F5888DRAFT_1643617 [Russula emetica]|nr:hypothetical protein F5888DRAFT_1643617 [Russula emetica]
MNKIGHATIQPYATFCPMILTRSSDYTMALSLLLFPACLIAARSNERARGLLFPSGTTIPELQVDGAARADITNLECGRAVDHVRVTPARRTTVVRNAKQKTPRQGRAVARECADLIQAIAVGREVFREDIWLFVERLTASEYRVKISNSGRCQLLYV